MSDVDREKGWAIVHSDYASIRDKVERAYRNGERLHLDVGQVRRLVRSPLFSLLAELVAKELAEECQQDQEGAAAPPPPTTTTAGPNSGHSGSTGARSAASGQSHGTMTEAEAALVESAERRRALAIVERAGGHPRRR
jgi:hypothetical protein